MDDQARDRLIEERERISWSIEDLRSSSSLEPGSDPGGELSGNDQHPADEGTETFNRERDLSIMDSLEAELGEIEMALARLDDGSYGVCEDCGRPIGDERLTALPATRLCIEHAAAREQAGI